MAMLAGKNDGFTKLIAALHLEPFLHQFCKDLSGRVFIEINTINGRSADKLRHFVLFFKSLLIGLFLLRRQIVIMQPLGRNFI